MMAARHEKQQSKNHDRNQREHDVKENSPGPRGTASPPIAEFGTLGNADLILMFEVPDELSSVRIALPRVTLEGAVDDFLQLRGNLGIDFPRWNRVVKKPVIHDDKWIRPGERQDRKSTRLNSSHSQISYAVFCLKKKKKKKKQK